jgi:hypothetical protein
MKIITLVQSTICALPLMAAAAYFPAQAAEQGRGSVAETDAAAVPGIAAGAVEDTLKACMARIPQDSSIGQRMMAEQGCWRDESDRKPSQSDHGPRQTSR